MEGKQLDNPDENIKEVQDVWVICFINNGGTEGMITTKNVDSLPKLLKKIQKNKGDNIIITKARSRNFTKLVRERLWTLKNYV